MNVAVCWAGPFPVQLHAHLSAQEVAADDFHWIDTTGDGNYWDALRRLWEDMRTVIVLEGDKFPAPGALQELWDCPNEWCSYPIPTREGGDPAAYPSLGCTKFDRTLMLSDPDLLRHVGELDLGLGVREWSRLDMGVAAFCENLTACHMHGAGRVEHRHPAN